MELLLNVVWLLLSLAGLGWCAFQQRALSGPRREWARDIVAVCMVALFLFPVISATDDLHPVQAMVEESAAKKIISIVHGASRVAPAHPVLFALLLALVTLFFRSVLIGRVLDETPVNAQRIILRRLEGRAPPFSAL